MTTITITLPDPGAVRVIEETIKAGMAPDQFIAKLIEERLRQPSPNATGAPKSDAAPQKKKPATPPKLNADGVKAIAADLRRFPGMPPSGDMPASKAKAERKPAKRSTRKN